MAYLTSMAARLTDRPLLLRHRARAMRANKGLFLHELARDELIERQNEVNRTFTSPIVIAPYPSLWPDLPTIDDTETLDLQPGAHDLVLHAMALHWADDPVGQLIQSRRALKPDGLFLGVLFGGETLHELRTCLTEAEARLLGGLSPRLLPMAEIRDIGALLQRAGLALPVADSQTITATYDSPRGLLHDLRAMGETSALASRGAPLRRDVLHHAEALYADRFADPSGRITATFDLIFLSGWAPADSQPKPLRPGSAAQRLADALGATEQPLQRDTND
ncbi:MAG: methyltransferase domain-containing protein [Pseudomonadota bacterium]